MALFPPGKGGGEDVGYGFKGKGITMHALTDGNGMPLSIISTSAQKSEQSQVMPLLEKARVSGPKRKRPRNCPDVIQMDKGYDSRPLRQELRNKGVRSIIPRRVYANCKQRAGRKPSSLIDRWKVERAFSWLQRKFRRLCVRWERRTKYWNGFVELAISFMWLTKMICG
jgi:transposase